MTINISKETAEKLNSGMQMGGGQELPFPFLFLFASSGQAALAALKNSDPAAYYGGFTVDAGPMQDLLDMGMQLPSGFVGPVERSEKGGRSFTVYSARHILIAPIAMRLSWWNKATATRKPEKPGIKKGERGFRHHMQLLAVLGTKVTEGKQTRYLPWHPVVISAFGHQVTKFQNALRDWKKHSAQQRALIGKEVGVTIPDNAFFLAVGTFGADRVQEMVGQPGAQSPITPVRAYLPDPLEKATLESLFVGESTVDQMAEMYDQAQEWIKAWDMGSTPADPNAEEGAGDDDNYDSNWNSAVEEEEEAPF